VGGATLGSIYWWLHDHGVTFGQMRRHHLCSTGSAFASSLQLHGSDLLELGVDAAVRWRLEIVVLCGVEKETFNFLPIFRLILIFV
jgi:hypothetical protein